MKLASLRLLLCSISLLLLLPNGYLVPSASAQGTSGLSVQSLKKLFPAQNVTKELMPGFKTIHADMNGDKKKEWVVVHDPNLVARQKYTLLKKRGCLCPKPKLKGLVTKIKKAMKWPKAIYDVRMIPVKRRSHDVKIRFLPKVAPKRTMETWMLTWCRNLGRKWRKWRKWRLSNVYFTSMTDGQTHRISYYRCRKLSRMSRRRRTKRFAKWQKKEANVTIKRCPCKKKQLEAIRPKKARPLQIVVAEEVKKKGAAPTDPLSFRIIGRLKGTDPEFIRLTRDGHIVGIKLEKVHQLTPSSPRRTNIYLYIYDQGNSRRLKRVFQITKSQTNDGRFSGARLYRTVTWRHMDGDDWKEIIVNSNVETPEFSGLLNRTMYKWNKGRYIPLNQYRGIRKVTASSSWKRHAPKSSDRALKKFLTARTHPTNIVDGFRNTIWAAKKYKRSINEWVRIRLVRNQRLYGVAISVEKPSRTRHIVSNLYPGSFSKKPKIVRPTYLLLKTSSGLQLPIRVDPTKRFQFVAFPSATWTSYIELRVMDNHQGKNKLKIPEGERSLAFIAEVVPIEARVRYVASSFAYKSGNHPAEHAGDKRSSTSWAEGRTDDGVGEWIQMILPKPSMLRNLTIVNGCKRAGERYILNNRIKNAKLTFSDGTTQDIVLKDTHKAQKVKIRPKRTLSVKLTIGSIYKGKLGHTTCITELRP